MSIGFALLSMMACEPAADEPAGSADVRFEAERPDPVPGSERAAEGLVPRPRLLTDAPTEPALCPACGLAIVFSR